MKRIITIISFIVILILIIILIDANMTKKIVVSDIEIVYHSPLIKKIKTHSCFNNQSQIFVILFKQEQKLEMWLSSDTCQTLIKEFPVELHNVSSGPRLYDNENNKIPEGIYAFNTVSDSNFVTINFPNKYDIMKTVADKRPLQNTVISFSSLKKDNAILLNKNNLKSLQDLLNHFNSNSISLIIIPSNINKNQQFSRCSQCPYWIIELYGQLKLSILPFI